MSAMGGPGLPEEIDASIPRPTAMQNLVEEQASEYAYIGPGSGDGGLGPHGHSK